MSRPDEVADASVASLRALSQFVVGSATLGSTLDRLVELAVLAIPRARYAGITMLLDGEVTTSVFSDPDVPEIDQAQYAANDGPCVHSFRTGEVNLVPSTDDDERWPEFSRAALEHGVHSTMSLPLRVGDGALGALNFYSEETDGFDERDQEVGAAFAAQAAVVLANTQAYLDAQTLNEQLEEAMQSRATIEQAKGILMAQSPMDPDAAFQVLRSASQRENRKLRDIAAELVERHSGPGRTTPT